MLLENNDQLTQREAQIASRSAALLTAVEAGETRIQTKTKELEAELNARTSSAHDTAEKKQIKAIMGKSNDRAISKLRRDLVAETAEQRKGIMAVVTEYLADVQTSADLFRSPLQVLSRHGLGDPKKTQILSQLVEAGPAELQSTIAYAQATNDRLTLSAALITADRGGKRHQSIDRAKLAQDAVGPEVVAIQTRLEDLRIRLTAMVTTNKAFESGVHSSQDKIKAGIAQRALAKRQEAAE